MLSPGAFRRLRKEEEMMRDSTDDEGLLFKAFPSMVDGAKDYETWEIYFTLQNNPIYKDNIIKAVMKFPADYPLRPPSLKFVSKMFHPNIYPDGKMCISILEEAGFDPTGYSRSEEKWGPVQNIRTVLLSIIVVLDEPNADSPADVDASVMYRDNREEYIKKARALAESEDRKLKNNDERANEVMNMVIKETAAKNEL